MEESEIILIEQAKKGSQLAFGKLYDMYSNMVLGVARTYARDDDTAHDLTNTVFIKIYEKLSLFVTNDSFEKWVKTIAINTCIDYVRKMKRERTIVSVDSDDTQIQIESEDPNPLVKLLMAERSAELEMAYKVLTPKQFELINLYYIDGYLYREIADKLAIPLGTVKCELHRAKLKLKKSLTKSNNKSQ